MEDKVSTDQTKLTVKRKESAVKQVSFKIYTIGAPVAEMIRASPLFRRTHCVEAGVVSSIPFAAGWWCPGYIMFLSCAVKFPVTILYGVVICNFDEDL